MPTRSSLNRYPPGGRVFQLRIAVVRSWTQSRDIRPNRAARSRARELRKL